ncbi:MAG: sulfite exporter TauE/SafE family protein [Betaproteobacteria bacterium]
MTSYLLLGFVVLITHFLEGITGFGCTVLALPFAIMLVGTKQAVPVLLFLALLLALYIVLIDRKKIVWKEFFKIVLFVGLGLPVGIMTFSYLNDVALKYILGVFMIVVSIRGLIACTRNINVSESRLPKWVLNLLLLMGGFIHGVFASGGPLVVIYAKKALPDKSNFRVTICMLWVTLNTVMLTQNLVTGKMTPEIWEIIGVCMPFLLVGTLAGNWAHHHIKDKYFTQTVYGVLLASGLFMFR